MVLLLGCKEPQHITIQYIKNDLFKASPGEASTVSVYPLYGYKYAGPDKTNTVLELCAVKHKGTKLLVIGSDRVTLNKTEDTELLKRRFKELTEEEARVFIEKAEELQKSAKGAKRNEQVHYDYTIKEGVVISVEQKGKHALPVTHLWIDGRDHPSGDGSSLIKAVKKFLAY